MKKVLVVILAGLLCVGTAQGCKKTATTTLSDAQETVILVMDTTQALLEGAQIKIGKDVFRTSWDGRIVLKQGIPNGTKSLQVTCDGYKPLTEKWATQKKHRELIILTLVPKPRSEKEDNKYYFADGALTRGKLYKPEMMAAMAEPAEDGVVESLSMADYKGRDYSHLTSANDIQAGKLTAGEVNDFTKWYFWTRVLDDSHKKFISDWRIETRNRFTVQVTNKDGYPIVSRLVSLVDEKGNTLFQAVTDNTGKAELWANLLGTQASAENLQIRVDDESAPAKSWSQGLNTFVLDEVCDASDAVDVVFVFDATGSMGDELHYLQAEMRDVINRAKDATGGLDIRTGAVVYRDHGDEYVTRLSRLTNDIKTTQTFIDKQSANGGGDFPEAIPEALMAAINSAGWNQEARARIAFLVLDAPCHKDSATIALLHEQILNAAAWGIRVVPVVCSGLDESGELLMRSIAMATNGTSFFLTDDSGIGHSHLKPTTDTLKVEHLNDMLVRTIVEFSTMPSCNAATIEDNIDEQFIPNPFEAQDIDKLHDFPHGPTTIYLLDVTGKLVAILNGDINSVEVNKSTFPISTGVYFLKAYIDNRWYTKKILVR
jgi:hypothetical protein